MKGHCHSHQPYKAPMLPLRCMLNVNIWTSRLEGTAFRLHGLLSNLRSVRSTVSDSLKVRRVLVDIRCVTHFLKANPKVAKRPSNTRASCKCPSLFVLFTLFFALCAFVTPMHGSPDQFWPWPWHLVTPWSSDSSDPRLPEHPWPTSDNVAGSGASVIQAWTTATFDGGPSVSSPAILLEEVGEDNRRPWCFSGTSGRIGIALRSPAIISHIAINITQELHSRTVFVRKIGSAPRGIDVWGLVDGSVSKQKVHNMRIRADRPIALLSARTDGPYQFTRVAHYEYDGRITAPTFQAFAVDPLIADAQIEFGLIVIEIKSNWGSFITCLNRLFVYQQNS
jgi:hypothetical protein